MIHCTCDDPDVRSGTRFGAVAIIVSVVWTALALAVGIMIGRLGG
jgi:hypothetical protein